MWAGTWGVGLSARTWAQFSHRWPVLAASSAVSETFSFEPVDCPFVFLSLNLLTACPPTSYPHRNSKHTCLVAAQEVTGCRGAQPTLHLSGSFEMFTCRAWQKRVKPPGTWADPCPHSGCLTCGMGLSFVRNKRQTDEAPGWSAPVLRLQPTTELRRALIIGPR